jgi:hypothetical protein
VRSIPFAHTLTALLMMRCRTGIAQSSALPRSKPVAGPDQRRTASRFLRPKMVEGLVYGLALRSRRKAANSPESFPTRPFLRIPVETALPERRVAGFELGNVCAGYVLKICNNSSSLARKPGQHPHRDRRNGSDFCRSGDDLARGKNNRMAHFSRASCTSGKRQPPISRRSPKLSDHCVG